jgi:Leucine-rich repeat (LRR) protein
MEHLCSLTRLEYLWLYQNKFSGSIPESIGNLTKLRYFDVDMNDFSGTLPKSFARLICLEIVSARENKKLLIDKRTVRSMLPQLEDITL